MGINHFDGGCLINLDDEGKRRLLLDLNIYF